MAQRHRLDPGSWSSVFRRLEELVLASSGEDDFQEVFKLLVAKLHQECFEDDATLRGVDAADTVARVEAALAGADRRWPQILADGVTPKLAPEHLQVCVETLDGLTLREAGLEVMDALFEHLVAKASKGSKGQFFTPRHVVEAAVRMVAPTAAETVCDPACGSGGFLVHALQHAGGEAERAWGFDLDPRALQVARALLVIAGHGAAHLHRLNSLLPPGTGQGPCIEDAVRGTPAAAGFDCLLTNPPFAGEVREPALLDGYDLARVDGRRNERDVLFAERCARLLRPGGRLAIVLPTNKVGGRQFGFVREWLLRELRVVAVLGLGRHTFEPHTSQKAEVVLAVRRTHPAHPADIAGERVLLLTSERDGKDAAGAVVPRAGAPDHGSLWDRADHDLGDAVDAFHSFVRDEQIAWGPR